MTVGVNPFIFTGTIVSIEDPNQGGACAVRVHGTQDDVSKIPDEACRWMRPMTSVHHAQLQGAGTSPHNMMKGTRVIGMYLDAEQQHPIIIGTIGASGDVAQANTIHTPISAKSSSS